MSLCDLHGHKKSLIVSFFNSHGGRLANPRRVRDNGRMKPVDPDTLGGRLRAARLFLNLTQDDFAASAGVKSNTYNQWETNKRKPEMEALIPLCEKWDLSLDYLFRGKLTLLSPQMRKAFSTSPLDR